MNMCIYVYIYMYTNTGTCASSSHARVLVPLRENGHIHVLLLQRFLAQAILERSLGTYGLALWGA